MVTMVGIDYVQHEEPLDSGLGCGICYLSIEVSFLHFTGGSKAPMSAY